MNVLLVLYFIFSVVKCSKGTLDSVKYHLQQKDTTKNKPCCIYKDLGVFDIEVKEVSPKEAVINVNQGEYPIKAQVKKSICYKCHKILTRISSTIDLLKSALDMKNALSVGHDYSVFMKSSTFENASKFVAALLIGYRQKINSAYCVLLRGHTNNGQPLSTANFKFLELIEDPHQKASYSSTGRILSFDDLIKKDYRSERIDFILSGKNKESATADKPMFTGFNGKLTPTELENLKIAHDSEQERIMARKAKMTQKYGVREKTQESNVTCKKTRISIFKIVTYFCFSVLVVFFVVIGIIRYVYAQ
jgi:hypothetical protein